MKTDPCERIEPENATKCARMSYNEMDRKGFETFAACSH